MKKIKRNFLSIFIICLNLLLVSFVVFFVCVAFVPIKSNNINKYLKTDGRISDFYVFPQSLSNIDEVIEYHYHDYRLLDGIEIVLIAKYNADYFDEEIKRLNSIVCESIFDDTRKTIAIDDQQKLFYSHAFVTIYDPDGIYEYAIVDFDKLTISYIYLEHLSTSKITLTDEQLPKIIIDDIMEYNVYHYDIYTDKNDFWFEWIIDDNSCTFIEKWECFFNLVLIKYNK